MTDTTTKALRDNSIAKLRSLIAYASDELDPAPYTEALDALSTPQPPAREDAPRGGELAAITQALRLAEAALSDIGDADREPGDDIAWAERRAAQALPAARAGLKLALLSAPPPAQASAPERGEAARPAVEEWLARYNAHLLEWRIPEHVADAMTAIERQEIADGSCDCLSELPEDVAELEIQDLRAALSQPAVRTDGREASDGMTCPECKSPGAVLFQCVACSHGNYPPECATPQAGGSAAEDAELWRKHKDSFCVLTAILEAASPLVLNKLKAQDATRDAGKP